MRYTTYKCDECGALKKQTNHWWVITQTPGTDGNLTITPMPPNLPDETVTVCGRECAQKAVERWMGEVSRAATQAEMASPSAAPAAPLVGVVPAAPSVSDISRARESRRRLKQVQHRSTVLLQQVRRAS